MRAWIAALVFFVSSWGATAEVRSLTSAANIEFLGDSAFSCKIFHQRVKESARNSAGLSGLMKELGRKRTWQAVDYNRLETLLLKAGFQSRTIQAKDFRVHLKWDLAGLPEWRVLLNSPLSLPVSYQFKGWQWLDMWGVLPSNVIPLWDSSNGILNLQMDLSALEICCGTNYFSLSIIDPQNGNRLDLNSVATWN